MEAELSSEVGAVGRLFKSCVDLYWALLQRILILKFKDWQKEALRDAFGKFYFWGDGFHPFEGRLDEILASSSRLRNRVLTVLVEVGEILCNEKSGLFALIGKAFDDNKLDDQRREVRALIEGVQETLEDATSSHSDSDSGSDFSDTGNLLEEIIGDLRSRNQCLIDLSGSLERPAADADLEETKASSVAAFKVSGPAEIWTRKVIDSYPNIDVTLAERLGEASWHRYHRVSLQWEIAEPFENQSESEDDDDDSDKVGDLPNVTETTRSSADPSSIFSSAGRQTNTTGTSVSNNNFDYAFPIARKRRMAKDIRSQATYTSVMSNDQGERGWLKIPAMPKAAESGKAFRCTICGDKCKEIFSQTEWKKHVFSDLQPYICTFQDCKGGLTSFSNRRAWADHEFSIHRTRKIWTCSDCAARFSEKALYREHAYSSHGNVLMRNQLEALVKSAEKQVGISEDNECPFCLEKPGNKSRAFAMHVGRHMEEVALAVLPRDSEFEDDQGSAGSSIESSSLKDKADDVLKHGASPAIDDSTFESQLRLLYRQSNFQRHNATIQARLRSRSEQPSTRGPRIGIEAFNFLAVIGKGNFSKVMLAEKKVSKELFAIKVIKKEFIIESDEVASVRSEKNVLLKATQEKHPFIVQLHATFQTETRAYFVLEYVSGGDLMLHIQRGQFGSKRAQFYAAEVCLVLKWFHDSHILYRDLKLDNILLGNDGHIKIADFGFCKESMLQSTRTKTFCGTPEFMAPEILLDKPYGFPIDWWAFGVLVYQMLLQQSPFRGEDEDEIYDAILADEPLYPVHMPRDSVDFIQRLLLREPEKRLGSGPEDAQEVMQHAFFRNIDWDDVYHKRISAPFIPSIEIGTDTRNFDSEFTSVTPVLTPVQSVLTQAMQEEFRGFSLGIPT